MNHLSTGAGLVASFIAGALVSASFAFSGAPVRTPVRGALARSFPSIKSATGADHRIDRLRNEAANGDELANDQLSTALLDRYDALGDDDDLYEALVWVDRRWDTFGHGPLVARVVGGHCSQRVVRWHWLCVLGE